MKNRQSYRSSSCSYRLVKRKSARERRQSAETHLLATVACHLCRYLPALLHPLSPLINWSLMLPLPPPPNWRFTNAPPLRAPPTGWRFRHQIFFFLTWSIESCKMQLASEPAIYHLARLPRSPVSVAPCSHRIK